MKNDNNNNVALYFSQLKKYPNTFPFHPPENYPEYTGNLICPGNEIYSGMRNIIQSLRMDESNFNTPQWNPFGDIIEPGMTVFVKPNTVTHVHEKKKDIFSVINHASVLRPILDYVCKALKGKGRIILADCQLYFSDFDKAWEISQFKRLLRWYVTQTAIPIEWFDLRINKGYRTYLYGRWGREKVEQDPRGYTFVDLAKASCFDGIDPKCLRIAIASYKNMRKHHTNEKHEYLMPQSLLASDVVINLSKLKTHRRTAVTLALKNFMGIPSLKDCLPHFQVGSVEEGGDQYIYPSKRKMIGTFLHDQIQSNPFIPIKCVCAIVKKLIWNSHKIVPFKDDIFEAMWPGNDTLWRTLYDLNRIVMYADKKGTMQSTIQRPILNLIDGIIAGESDGPLTPNPVYAGVLLGGFNQVAIDAVGATLMGFDIDKIPLINKAFSRNDDSYSLFQGDHKDISIINGTDKLPFDAFAQKYNLKFTAHPNWISFVERDL